ncbi:hypothetical protein GCM10010124_37410 [Pilimelia terevasa]|uniref:Helix-hairpin-helix DNA-binding motif class 1 domain-containing protein n=1 Tax=Pilimelia terevasa TaxID=53372 RepID=A0A8J3BQG1_9ACTN|nr:hypothetical protein GCM10010124_37410 [Pilimelia terevasa]
MSDDDLYRPPGGAAADDPDPWPDPPPTVPDVPRTFGATAFDRPSGWLLDPGRRGLRALAVVAVIVVVIAAAAAWWSRPRVDPVPEPAESGLVASVPAGRPAADATGAPPADGAAPGSAGPPGGAAAEVVVSVGGRVRRPGLVRLPAGARVADAVAAAGGVLAGAATPYLNLARRVVDGELILVGVTPPPGGIPGAAPAAGSGAGPAAPAGRVNLNTATVAQFDTLPGVGPVLAARLVEFRERNGGFRAVADLRRVDGIGSTRYERLKDLVAL